MYYINCFSCTRYCSTGCRRIGLLLRGKHCVLEVALLFFCCPSCRKEHCTPYPSPADRIVYCHILFLITSCYIVSLYGESYGHCVRGSELKAGNETVYIIIHLLRYNRLSTLCNESMYVQAWACCAKLSDPIPTPRADSIALKKNVWTLIRHKWNAVQWKAAKGPKKRVTLKPDGTTP